MEMAGFILFAFAAVAAVMLFVLRGQDSSRAKSLAARTEVLEKELAQLKTDATSRKETLEARTRELTEAKEKLRDTKKRLHDEKGTNRQHEIDHATAEVERAASAQVEAARHEAAQAQLELKRLQSELEIARGKRRPDAKVEPRAEVKVDLSRPDEPAAPEAKAEPRPPRELTPIEQDRISLLERQAVKQAERVKQLEEEAKRNQRRAENTDKAYKVAKSELELGKAKMTTIEKRLNKTLLELDGLRQRAFKAGMVNEIVAAQSEAEEAAPTAPADTPLPSREAEA